MGRQQDATRRLWALLGTALVVQVIGDDEPPSLTRPLSPSTTTRPFGRPIQSHNLLSALMTQEIRTYSEANNTMEK